MHLEKLLTLAAHEKSSLGKKFKVSNFPSASRCCVVVGRMKTRSQDTSRNAKITKEHFSWTPCRSPGAEHPRFGFINYPWALVALPAQPFIKPSNAQNDILTSIPLLPHEERLAYKNVDIVQNKRRHPKASEPYHRVLY